MNIAESDLMIYILAVEKQYYELLELYGILFEHATCPHCKKDTGVHYKAIRDIIETFGGKTSLKIPLGEDLAKVSREINIWRTLKNCKDKDSRMSRERRLKVEEYAARYEMTLDNIYKIEKRIQTMVEKFIALKGMFKKGKH